MGCGNPKEKIEDELLKAKLEKTEIQYLRQQQMKLLKELDGTEYKSKVLPEEGPISPNEQQNNIKKPTTKTKTLKLGTKRSQSLSVKKKTHINRENTNDENLIKKRKSFKKSIKI